MTKRLLSFLGLLLLFCGSGWAQYTFKVIDPPPGADGLAITAINNAGRMVGVYSIGPESKPVKIDAQGRFLPLVVGNATGVIPLGLNNRGDISGYCAVRGQSRAFILYRNGAVRINKITGASETYGTGLNDSDTRVGFFQVPDPNWPGPRYHGFIATQSGKLTTIDFPDTDPYQNFTHDTSLVSINNKAQLVGFSEIWDHGESRTSGFFRDSNGTFTELRQDRFNTAYGMNNLGEIIGWTDSGDGTYSWTWCQGAFTTVEYPGAVLTGLSAINDLGQLAGWASDGVNSFAFVATPAE